MCLPFTTALPLSVGLLRNSVSQRAIRLGTCPRTCLPFNSSLWMHFLPRLPHSLLRTIATVLWSTVLSDCCLSSYSLPISGVQISWYSWYPWLKEFTSNTVSLVDSFPAIIFSVGQQNKLWTVCLLSYSGAVNLSHISQIMSKCYKKC